MQVLDGHQSAVYALAFSPDGDRLASGDKDGTVLLWEGSGPRKLDSTADLYPLLGAQGINDIAFAPDGRLLVLVLTNRVRLVPVDNAVNERLVAGVERCTSAVFVGNQRALFGGGSRTGPAGGSLLLVDLLAGRSSTNIPAAQGVRSVAAVGERVAWCEWGRVAYVWDIRKPDRMKLPLPAEAPCLALSPDGTTLAVGLDSYKLKLFDVDRKQERRELAGHKGRITGVAFTPDGGTVVSGSWDGTVRLWGADDGTLRQTFSWPVGKQVTSLAVSPDGLRLAVGGDTGVVVLADLD